jgi:type VI secretion system secreted protein Hcp
MFLKLDGIAGESTDKKHKNEIEVFSFHWGVANPGHATDPAGGLTRGTFQDFHFVCRTQKSSPQLFLHCASGEHIKEGILSTRKATGKEVDYLKIVMTDCLISSFEQGAHAGGRDNFPLEEVSMNFVKFEITYKQLSPKGSVIGTTTAAWDLKNSGQP